MFKGKPVHHDDRAPRRRVGDADGDQYFFSKTADTTHEVNLRKRVMRGGYRL